MIRNFKCKETQAIFQRFGSRKFRAIERVALRKLIQMEGAERLDDLFIPPANRLEKLKGKRSNQHSIRINDQWRICFEWKDGSAWNVEIVDYH